MFHRKVTGSMTAEKTLEKVNLNATIVPLTEGLQIPIMGTSGLRKAQAVYNKKEFLEQFIQGIADHFNTLEDQFLESKNRTIILGGDPRLGNDERIYKAAEILAANGFKVMIALQDRVASTPAMSHAIRHENAVGGIIFTASHNPFTDVGIKVNIHDGSPALEDTIKNVHKLQNEVKSYKTIDFEAARAKGFIRDIDTVKLYTDLLDKIFDFTKMKLKIKELEKKLGRPLKIALDGMGGAAGPYLTEIFINRLGLNPEIIRGVPDKYLGGPNDEKHPNHPEPDFDFIPEQIKKNMTKLYDLVAAYDSDVDRRIDGGSGFWVESADQKMIFAKYAHLIGIQNLYLDTPDKTITFARSSVTAPTIDLMQADLEKQFAPFGLKVRILQTATGFKYIAEYGNFGVEESNGVGNPWLREKDGIFSTVFLLKIMLETGKTPQQLMEEIWKQYGRVYFTRGEISSPITEDKIKLDAAIKKTQTDQSFIGKKYGDLTLLKASTWDYIDPKGNLREKDSVNVFEFSDGVTVKARYSGTGSGGYTLRIYVTKYDKRYNLVKKEITGPAKKAIAELIKAAGFTAEAPKAYTDANQPDPYEKPRVEKGFTY